MSDKKQQVSAQRLSGETIFTNKWITVLQDKFRMNTGYEGDYMVIERPAGIMILPVSREDGIIYTYLVKQYRYPIGKEILQFPMGSLEENVDPLEQAKKELHEETGFVSDTLKFFTKYYVDPGLSRQVAYVYIADGIAKKGKQELEATEAGMQVHKLSLTELDEKIENKEITDAWVYAGVYMLKQYLKKRKSENKAL